MRAIVSASARFVIDESDQLWINSQSIDYNFWARYLDVYDEIHLLVRAQPVTSPPQDYVLATGSGIYAMPLPYYHGATQFLKQIIPLRQALKHYIDPSYAIHLRAPLLLASSIVKLLPKGYPYGVEIVGDPYDVFARGSTKHPLRAFFRWWYKRELEQLCVNAYATAYVTEKALQKRYPPAQGAYTTHFSSIQLTDKAITTQARQFEETNAPIKIISVGSFDQLYKAQDVLIKAIAECVKWGLDIHLTLMGDGQQRTRLEKLVEQCGLSQHVHFLGYLSAENAVREQLDKADLFVLPSRQEGLPRAMIEAMARALPCIGSTVGGISELLPDKDMVVADDEDALAKKIAEIITNPARMTEMSARNLETAKAYRVDVIRKRRIAFYQQVKEATQAWVKT